MRRYVFTLQAERDLDEIARYLDNLPKIPALRIGRELERTLTMLAERPMLGRIDGAVIQTSSPPVFRFRSGDYVIFYQFTETVVTFLTVLHGRRDVDARMSERTE